MKSIVLLFLTFLLLIPQAGLAQQPSPPLTVYVSTIDGTPKPGLTVTVQAENFRETAVTNATGYAVLRQLSPGTYEVIISLRNIELIRRTINYPSLTTISETAPLATLTVKVVDLSGRPVANVFATLTSTNGLVSVSQRTNATGYTVFRDVPFSTLSSIGAAYRLRVVKDGTQVAEIQKDVQSFIEFAELVAKLVKANFTFLDSGGSRAPIDGTLTLSGRNATQRVDIKAGTAEVSQLVSSAVVGSYNASLSIRLGTRNVVVYSSLLNIESDADLVLRADVGELVVKAVDPSGQPVKGIGVLVGAPGYGNFSSGITDDNGLVKAGFIPTSARIEKYQISLFRGRTKVLVETVALTEAKTTKEITLPLQRIVFNVVDYRGAPLSNAVLTIKDPITARTYNVTTVNGAASADVFPGPNELQVSYKNTVVYRRVAELKGGTENIRLLSVNFPVRVYVLDSLGKPVENLRAVIRSGESTLFDGRTSSAPLTVELERPAEILIDLYSGQELIIRERRLPEGPTDIDVRLARSIAFGETLLSFDIIVLMGLSVVLAMMLSFAVFLGKRPKQR
ncbi:MAG: carboxypeptidase-like regulatory domain-containing protein [Candidatus Caldarchaeum sp.]|nr:carboxypeptidase-like regulatory domain-containing protein [Candidatus Caldarchaeum sp.]